MSGKRSSLKDRDLSENRYVYDAAGRLVAEELAAGRSVYFEYDASGMLAKRPLPGDAVQAYWTYDRAGRLLNLVNRNPSAGVLCSFYYSRDPAGQITQIDREGGRRVYYEYDALNRLTLERQYNSTPAIIYGFSYSFDAASNRATKVDSVATQATYYSYDVRNLLTKEYALQANVTTYYAHDAAQRMTSSRVTGSGQSAYFGHDQRSQIKRIDFAKFGGGADTIRYFGYNGVGERVRVVDDGGTETYWTYDGSKKVLTERDVSSTLRRYRHNQGTGAGGPVEYTNSANAAIRFYPASGNQGIYQQVDGTELIPRITIETDAKGVEFGRKFTGISQVEHLGFGAAAGLWRLASAQLIYPLPVATLLLPGIGRRVASWFALALPSGLLAQDGQTPSETGTAPDPLWWWYPGSTVGGGSDPRDDGGATFGEEIDEPCSASDQEIRRSGPGLLSALLVPGSPTGQTNYNLWYWPTKAIQRCCNRIAFLQIIRRSVMDVLDSAPTAGHAKLLLENRGSFEPDDQPSAGGTGWPLPIMSPPLYPYQLPWVYGEERPNAFLEDAPGAFQALTFPYNLLYLAGNQEIETCAVCVDGVKAVQGAVLSCFRWQHFVDSEGVKGVEILSRRIFVNSVRAWEGTYRLRWMSASCCRPSSNFMSVLAADLALSDRLLWR